MCEVITYSELQVNAFDPTRTTTLRRAFVADVNRRFRALTTIVWKAVVTDDCFGLRPTGYALDSPGYRAFDFTRSVDKVEGFMRWFNQQVDRGILQTSQFSRVGTGVEAAWTNMYIADSYKRGVMRAQSELGKAGYAIPSMAARGGIDVVMGLPFHVDRVGLLYSRTFSELKGITASMDSQISRILAQGIADGDNPNLLARKLVATINGSGAGDLAITDSLGRFIPAQRRAQTMARTEIIRAHHMANMQEYKNWEVDGFIVEAEFVTAGDDRVCTECAGYHGNVYELKVVENLIPVHPNCFIDPQTPIYTSTGWKPIGKIEVGDLVLTHKYRFRKVTQLIRTAKQSPEVVQFTFEENPKLTITANHPILDCYTDKWRLAKDFKEGDYVERFKKTFFPTKIKSIKRWVLKKPRTLYNFSVEEDESYIAKGVVVHNCRCIAIPVEKTRI